MIYTLETYDESGRQGWREYAAAYASEEDALAAAARLWKTDSSLRIRLKRTEIVRELVRPTDNEER